MCQGKLSGQIPEPNIAEVTSSFGKLKLCHAQHEKEGSENSPCEKSGPFAGMEGDNSVPHLM